MRGQTTLTKRKTGVGLNNKINISTFVMLWENGYGYFLIQYDKASRISVINAKIIALDKSMKMEPTLS